MDVFQAVKKTVSIKELRMHYIVFFGPNAIQQYVVALTIPTWQFWDFGGVKIPI